jgi:hypothetical protein
MTGGLPPISFVLATNPLRPTIRIFIFQLNISCYSPYVTSSLTKRTVCRLQFLLALAHAVILGSESLGTRGHGLLSQIRDFPFRRLLRLIGLRWRYSTPPPHGKVIPQTNSSGFIIFGRPCTAHLIQWFSFSYLL